MTKDNLKFILAVYLAATSLSTIAVSAIICREIMGSTVTEMLLTVVPLGSLGSVIVVILLVIAACDERDAARHDNTLPKRRSR